MTLKIGDNTPLSLYEVLPHHFLKKQMLQLKERYHSFVVDLPEMNFSVFFELFRK